MCAVANCIYIWPQLTFQSHFFTFGFWELTNWIISFHIFEFVFYFNLYLYLCLYENHDWVDKKTRSELFPSTHLRFNSAVQHIPLPPDHEKQRSVSEAINLPPAAVTHALPPIKSVAGDTSAAGRSPEIVATGQIGAAGLVVILKNCTRRLHHQI